MDDFTSWSISSLLFFTSSEVQSCMDVSLSLQGSSSFFLWSLLLQEAVQDAAQTLQDALLPVFLGFIVPSVCFGALLHGPLQLHLWQGRPRDSEEKLHLWLKELRRKEFELKCQIKWITFKNELSTFVCGVPQGSVLRPDLFALCSLACGLIFPNLSHSLLLICQIVMPGVAAWRKPHCQTPGFIGWKY